MENYVNNRTDNSRKEYTLSPVRANVYGALGLIPSIFFVYLYLYIYGIQAIVNGLGNLENDMVLLIVLLIGGTIAHEGLHGLTWSVCGKVHMDKIRFGVHWKLLTPYAHCQVPLNANAYRWGVVMPAIVVGFIPAIIGTAFQSPILLWFGALFIMGAGGDFVTLWLLRRVPGEFRVEDHPSKVGCIVWASASLSDLDTDQGDIVQFDYPTKVQAPAKTDSSWKS